MWHHGYHSRTTYSSGFYRELAPDWLDFAALVQSHQSPRHDSHQFRYLELGSGMGFGLCQLAAAYPEGQFVGVDFNPSHIAQSQTLAKMLGLSNITFVDGDFVDLANSITSYAAPPIQANSFHYVAAHGIYTWVVDQVRDALLQLASRALRAGGIFYCSYNCYPGWLGRSVFQKLLQHEQRRSDPTADKACFQTTIRTCHHLLGTAESPSPLGASLPFLRNELDHLDLRNLNYLNGEYSNAGWAPVYSADIHSHCAEHRLTFLSSASLPDCFEVLLASSLKELVLQEKNPILRQLLIDLATNKSFRRDVFVKGPNTLSQAQTANQLGQIGFLPLQQKSPSADHAEQDTPSAYVFMTSFGQVIGDPGVYAPIAKQLANAQGCTMAQLQNSAGASAEELPIITSLFLDAGRITFDRSELGMAAIPAAQHANQCVLELIQMGRDHSTLILPLAGTSVEISLVEVLILQAHIQGLEGHMLASCVNLGLEALGAKLLDEGHSPIAKMKDVLEKITAAADDFLNYRLPMMRRLGAFPDEWF